MSNIDSKGMSYGRSRATSYDGVAVPYAGAIYDVTKTVSVYTGYSEIFSPQTEVDINRNRLDPVDGTNLEAGIKSELFARRLNAALAVFRTEQSNVAEPVGTIPGTADTYYRGVDGLTSNGFEVDVAGEAYPGVQLASGYTYLDIEDKDGSRARTFIPRHLVRALASYRPASLAALKLGLGVNWQSQTYVDSAGARDRQDAYLLLRAMAGYDFSPKLSAALNINNLTDEKYLASLYWAGSNGQGFYAAPRNASLTVTWRY